MKAISAIFVGGVLLSGVAFADNVSDADRANARAWACCDAMVVGDARTKCFNDARIADTSRTTNKRGYWSPDRVADRAAARTRQAAHTAGEVVKGEDATARQDQAKHGKDGYWKPERMADRAKTRVKKAADAVERKVEGKDNTASTTSPSK